MTASAAVGTVIVAHYGEGGHIVGVLGWNMAGQLRADRGLVIERAR